MSFIKKLASDLLTLEVNTILIGNINTAKAPASQRKMFLEVAQMYRDLLEQYKVEAAKELGMEIDPNNDMIYRWKFGGYFSFVELENYAKVGWKVLHDVIKTLDEGEIRQDIFSKIRMLDRVIDTCESIEQMFVARKKEYATNMGKANFAESFIPIQFDPLDHTSHYASHLDSQGWNNDISEGDIEKIEDMELSPAEISLIRKAYEIGTAQILIQTKIQIDGDITTYITRPFINQQKDIQQTILGMHNDSIQRATQFWSHLFDTIINLAGQSFDKIFAKKK